MSENQKLSAHCSELITLLLFTYKRDTPPPTAVSYVTMRYDHKSSRITQ